MTDNYHQINFKRWLRIAAIITLAAFVFNTVSQDYAYAARPTVDPSKFRDILKTVDSLQRPFSIKDFQLPRYLGEVRDISIPEDILQSQNFIPKNRQEITVIHIQDAHCNYDAQHSIAELVKYFSNIYGIRTINLEGGEGRYDLSIFTDIKNMEIRKKVADYFIKSGELSGSEFYAVMNPEKVELWGVENSDLYIKNLNVYRDLVKEKKTIDRLLNNLSYLLSNLKIHIFNKELIDFDTQYRAFKNDNLDFKEYIDILAGLASRHGVILDQYVNISSLLQAIALENEIDFKQANRERDQIIDVLQRDLSKLELEELIIKVVQFKFNRISQEGFYGYLVHKALCIGLDIKEYPNLDKYKSYVSAYEGIDKIKLFEEIEYLEEALRDKISDTPEQKTLFRLSKTFEIMKKILNVQLTKQHYKYYVEHKRDFDIHNFTSFINKNTYLYKIDAKLDEEINLLNGYVREIEKFYGYTFERDKAFLKNLKFGENDKRTMVLITGGFHTERLCELMKERNIPYVSIIPKLQGSDENESPYFRLLSGESSEEHEKIAQALGISTIAIASMFSQLGIKARGEEKGLILRVMEEMKLAIAEGKMGIKVIHEGKTQYLGLEWETVSTDAARDEDYREVVLSPNEAGERTEEKSQMGKRAEVRKGSFRLTEPDDDSKAQVTVRDLIANEEKTLDLTKKDQVVLGNVLEIMAKSDMSGYHRALITAMLSPIDEIMPTIYTFVSLIEDLFGFAAQRGKIIGLYEPFQENPVAVFHELGEGLIKAGRIKLEYKYPIAAWSKGKIIIKDKDGKKIDDLKITDEEAYKLASKNDKDQHYLLRALQREVFGDADRELSKEISLYQLGKIVPEDRLDRIRSAVDVSLEDHKAGEAFLNFARWMETIEMDKERIGEIIYSLSQRDSLISQEAVESMMALAEKLDFIGAEKEETQDTIHALCDNERFDAKESADALLRLVKILERHMELKGKTKMQEEEIEEPGIGRIVVALARNDNVTPKESVTSIINLIYKMRNPMISEGINDKYIGHIILCISESDKPSELANRLNSRAVAAFRKLAKTLEKFEYYKHQFDDHLDGAVWYGIGRILGLLAVNEKIDLIKVANGLREFAKKQNEEGMKPEGIGKLLIFVADKADPIGEAQRHKEDYFNLGRPQMGKRAEVRERTFKFTKEDESEAQIGVKVLETKKSETLTLTKTKIKPVEVVMEGTADIPSYGPLRDLLIKMVLPVETVSEPIALYTYDTLIEDLFGFALPKTKGIPIDIIGVYHSLRDNPIAVFHETARCRIDSGQITLEYKGPKEWKKGRTGEIIIHEKWLDEREEIGRITIKGEALAIALQDIENPHYLLRGLQRQIFGDADKELSKEISLIQLGEIIPGDALENVRSSLEDAPDAYQPAEVLLGFERGLEKVGIDEEGRGSILSSLSENENLVPEEAIDAFLALVEGLDAIGIESEGIKDIISSLCENEEIDPRETVDPLIKLAEKLNDMETEKDQIRNIIYSSCDNQDYAPKDTADSFFELAEKLNDIVMKVSPGAAWGSEIEDIKNIPNLLAANKNSAPKDAADSFISLIRYLAKEKLPVEYQRYILCYISKKDNPRELADRFCESKVAVPFKELAEALKTAKSGSFFDRERNIYEWETGQVLGNLSANENVDLSEAAEYFGRVARFLIQREISCKRIAVILIDISKKHDVMQLAREFMGHEGGGLADSYYNLLVTREDKEAAADHLRSLIKFREGQMGKRAEVRKGTFRLIRPDDDSKAQVTVRDLIAKEDKTLELTKVDPITLADVLNLIAKTRIADWHRDLVSRMLANLDDILPTVYTYDKPIEDLFGFIQKKAKVIGLHKPL